MVQKSMEVQLDNGLEARPVKSIMGMMSLGLDNGETLTVVADGSDESAAVAHIERFLSGQDA